MKKFFITFKRTLTDFSLYNDLLTVKSLKRGLKYALKLSFFFSIVMALILFGYFNFSSLKSKINDAVFATIPPDLKATIKGHEFSINKPEPFIISSDSLNVYKKGEIHRKNFVYIDTKLEPKIDLNKNFDATVVVTKDKIIVEKNPNGQVQIYPLSDMSDIEITQIGILQVVDVLFGAIWIFAILSLVPLTIMNFFSVILVAIFAGLIVKIISLFFKKKISFKQSFIVSIFASSIFGLLTSLSLLIPVSLFWPKVIATSILVTYFISKIKVDIADSLVYKNDEDTTNI